MQHLRPDSIVLVFHELIGLSSTHDMNTEQKQMKLWVQQCTALEERRCKPGPLLMTAPQAVIGHKWKQLAVLNTVGFSYPCICGKTKRPRPSGCLDYSGITLAI